MGFKEKVAKVLRTVRPSVPTAELIFAGGLIAAGTAVLIVYADEIAEVNRKVSAAKEEIKEVDKDKSGWDEMGETKTSYILRTTKECGVGYVKAAGIGVTCITGGIVLAYISHASITAQLEATAASLASTTAILTNYRQRVIADVGAEKDFEYYTGVGVKKTVEVQPDGTINEVITPIETPNAENYILNSIVFDKHNPNWTPNADENLNFIFNSLRSINIILENSPYETCTVNKMRECFMEPPTVAGACAGAVRTWEDGSTHRVRLNPILMQRMIDGTDNTAILQFQYDDGTDLESDIFKHANRLGIELF